MSKTKWYKGAPSSIGWWPASYERDKKVIRWWDGKCWSWGVSYLATSQTAAEFAWKKSYTDEIEWTKRWWL